MKVNMTPNPLDVVTIHASQGDTEARQWEFELHNNGELIDTSEITEQLFFKAYKGGTEQLLPENTSTPTTSPFKGDIRYPQGLLTDQEFTYRQSPTESDGLAKITDIKGNTLNWNQLIKNGNFETATDWINSGSSYTVSNGVATVKSTNASNQFGIYQRFQRKANHTYFISFEMHPFGTIRVRRNRFSGGQEAVTEGIYQRIETALTDTELGSAYQICFGEPVSDINADYFTLKNYMIIDLTQMGLDITDPSDFTSLFPLPYYAYNQGTLLSFMGNGIKTVGKNLFNKSTDVLNAWINTATQTLTSGSNYRTAVLRIIPSTTYTISKTAGKAFRYALFSEYPVLETTEYNSTNANHTASSITFTSSSNDHYLAVLFWSSGNGDVLTPEEMASSVMVEFGSSATNYEPYTSSTLSLPISTYFPNGMDGVGTDYDELTNTKATTRMTRVDLGSLDWNYNPTYGMYSTGISNSVKKPSASSVRANAISTIGTLTDWTTFYASGTTSGLWAINTSGYIGIATTETNSTTFKNSLQGVYLVYPLTTPIETSFTTASLVTENGEIPLSNEDGVLIGKCTEQLSAEPGFRDAKIKLADTDGECYSNKVQLHIERSPQ